MEDLRKELLKSFHYFFIHLDFPFTKLYYCLNLLHVQTGMASGPKLVIHLKDPNVNVQIINDQFCQGQLEFTPILDVICAHWNRDIAKLKDALSATLCRIYYITCSLVWLSAHDWNAELY